MIRLARADHVLVVYDTIAPYSGDALEVRRTAALAVAILVSPRQPRWGSNYAVQQALHVKWDTKLETKYGRLKIQRQITNARADRAGVYSSEKKANFARNTQPRRPRRTTQSSLIRTSTQRYRGTTETILRRTHA